MERKLTSTSRIWKTGQSAVVTVPLSIKRILNIEFGDTIIVDWGEVIKKNENYQDKKNNKEDLPKIEEEEDFF